MKNKDFFLLLGGIVVITAAVNYVVSLAIFPTWVSLILYTLSFVVVAFVVLFVMELIDRWKRYRKNVKRLLHEDELRRKTRELLHAQQGEILDWDLSNRKVDFELVKKQVELIRKNLLNSIQYEKDSIEKKERIIEGNKQLLDETFKGIRWGDDNEKINKETKTL